MEPPPSVPSAIGTNPSATAAALPPEEPPLFFVTSNGLRVGPKSGLSVAPRKPIIGLFVFPTIIEPACSAFSAYVQYISAILSFNGGIPPNVDGQPGLKSNKSLIAVGMP